MTDTDLVALARSLETEALESAWSEAIVDPNTSAVAAYCDAIEALCDNDMTSKALSLAAPMVEALSEKGELDGAIELAQRVVARGAHNDALARSLYELLERRWGTEDWYPLIRERAGLSADHVSSSTLAGFAKLRRYTAGHVVYHAAGWNEGVVEQFHTGRQEVTVAFATGRREDFPLNTLIDSFKPLEDDDLRAMRLLAKPELERLVAEDPAALLRKAARLYRGRITSAQAKTELCPSVVPTKKWASFWKKVKAAAAHDPWLKVEGSPTRPVFELRTKPLSLTDEARTALTHADDLGQRIAVLRDYLVRSNDPGVRETLLDLGVATVEEALAKGDATHAHVLDGILFLEEKGRQTSVPAAQELRILLLDGDGTFDPQAIDLLATQESRDHAVTLLKNALGDGWADLCIQSLPDIPASVVEQVVDMLVDEKHGARVLDVWEQVAPYPHRHPILTYLLGRLYADGVFDDREDQPNPLTVGRVLLHLARVCNSERRRKPLMGRLLTRLVSLMTGRRAFLPRALEGISRENLGSYLGITERAGSDFPQEIVDGILRVVADRYPDLTAKPDRPFWDRENTYMTAQGLARLREDYRLLIEVKIPENSKAIGVAASHGDLSENSEWDAAMEEQRNLTSRAADIQRELRNARLIEDQDIPRGLAAPGTRVQLTDVVTSESMAFTILGPADASGDDVINYRAPVAQAVLGKAAGEEVEMPTAHGPRRMRIDSVDRVV